MRTLIALLALGCVAVTGLPRSVSNAQQRIVGGSVTTIDRYPHIVSMLLTTNWVEWRQSCGGSIINSRHILTAAHCINRMSVGMWRARVGATWADSGGVVHNINRHTVHPQYNLMTMDNDIAIVRTASNIAFNNNVQAGVFAGATYNVANNQPVWAAGWGLTSFGGQPSAQLRHVQLYKINLATCRDRYRNNPVTANMLCAGVLNVGGRATCHRDSGGPLYHGRVIVGVTSWGLFCGDPQFPSVFVRVQQYTNWIRNNS